MPLLRQSRITRTSLFKRFKSARAIRIFQAWPTDNGDFYITIVTKSSFAIHSDPDMAGLELLMRHADQVVTRSVLLENVWDSHFDPQTDVTAVHISKLREKIDAGGERQRLWTMRNAGYMLTTDA